MSRTSKESKKGGERFLTLGEVKKERGFSKGLVEKLLGPPDLLKTNPKFKNSSPMQLFLETRVLEAQKSPLWTRHQETRKKLSASHKSINQSRREKLFLKVEKTPIAVKKLERDVLYKKSINHWLSRQDYDCTIDSNIDQETLDRWAVNFVRHELTKYDLLLDENFGKVGKSEAYFLIKGKVLEKISLVYPFLKDACDKQRKKLVKEREMADGEHIV